MSILMGSFKPDVPLYATDLSVGLFLDILDLTLGVSLQSLGITIFNSSWISMGGSYFSMTGTILT